MRCSLLLTCFVLVMTVCPAVAAHVAWSHQPGFGLAGGAGAVIGDLDADGRHEAIVTVALAPGVSSALAVIGGKGNSVEREQLLLIDGVLRSDIVLHTHPGGDRVLALVQPGTGEHVYSMVEFAGIPLRETRRVVMPQYTRPLAVADIDANGTLDLLAITGPYPLDGMKPAILDYATLETLWTDNSDAATAVLAQLDADAALEIVVAGMPGRVIDGATRLPDWSYPAGFGELLFVGEFDADVAGNEFASMHRDMAFPLLTIFRAAPLSPLRDVAAQVDTPSVVTVHDLDGDGRDELVFLADGDDGSLAVLTPATGAARTMSQSDFRIVGTAAGNLVGDGAAELVLVDGDGFYTTVDMLRVVDSGTGAEHFAMQRTFGPYTALAAADLDGDGHEEVVHALQRIAYTEPTQTHCILDGSSGQERTCMRSEVGWVEAAPVAGEFNASAGKDIAFLGNTGVIAIDGATAAPLWRRQDIWPSMYADSATMRFNDDAIDDVVLLAGEARITVLDGRDGSTLWQSVALGAPWGQEPRLVVANVDEDEAPELVVSTGDDIYAFDAATRLLDWSMDGTVPIARLLVWGENGGCRLGLYSADGGFRTLRCDDRSVAAPERSLPAGAMLVRALAPHGTPLLLAVEGHLLTIDEEGAVSDWSGFLGNALGLDDTATVIARGSRRHDVYIGSDAVVARIRVDFDLVFADAFE